MDVRQSRLLPILVAVAVLGGCASSLPALRLSGPPPIDAMVVPGCPAEADGRPSRCQLERALTAAGLWERGVAANFIVSGAAVHNPFGETYGLAAAMVVAGVPPERIALEPNALHTDENMYYSMDIARLAGWKRLGVVSRGGHAVWGCDLIRGWRHACRAFGIDQRYVDGRLLRHAAALTAIRTRPETGWVPLAERKERIALATGTRRRSSAARYPWLTIRAWFRRLPALPGAPRPRLVTWAQHCISIAATGD